MAAMISVDVLDALVERGARAPAAFAPVAGAYGVCRGFAAGKGAGAAARA